MALFQDREYYILIEDEAAWTGVEILSVYYLNKLVVIKRIFFIFAFFPTWKHFQLLVQEFVKICKV